MSPARSPFALRGIVEGSYGRPWDMGQRTRILAWMATHDFNAYIHAPKEDLYQRTNWRDPYPAGEMVEYAAEIRTARANGIQWIPNLSPALPEIPTPAVPTSPPSLPLCFSCPEDLEAVLAKFEPFRLAGARTFMVSFDDVIPALADPRDIAAFGGANGDAFGRANGVFLTQLLAALRKRTPGAHLMTVGADYSGTAATGYLDGLRASLDPAIEVMWTGPGVPAQAFTAADAEAYGEAIGRKPVLWDNWTNDDSAGNAVAPVGTARIFLGPYRRAAGLAPALGGIFLNPANEADLNLLPLTTAADYMRAPGRYRSRRSWQSAIDELACGQRTRRGRALRRCRAQPLRESLRAWAETSFSTKLGPIDAPTFSRLGDDLLRALGAGGQWPRALRLLAREQQLVIEAPGMLPSLKDREIAKQAASFLEAGRDGAQTGLEAGRMLGAERPGLRVKRAPGDEFVGRVKPPDLSRVAVLRRAYEAGRMRFQSATKFVYGWRFGIGIDIPPYAAGPNALEGFLDQVAAADSEFQSRATQAASSVSLTLAGAQVAVGPDGSFEIAASDCGKALVAVDGSGRKTVRRLPDCP